MEAGRELDALVAETVMGWRWIPYRDGAGKSVQLLWHDDRGQPSGDDFDRVAPLRLVPWNLPQPSRRIDDAVEVAERLIKKEMGEFRLIHRQTFGPEPQFAAGFAPHPKQEPIYSLAHTAPHAISLAALRAVGEDV